MKSKKIYKIWLKVEIEMCDYSNDEYINLIESEPLEVGETKGYTKISEAVEVYNDFVNEHDNWIARGDSPKSSVTVEQIREIKNDQAKIRTAKEK